MRRPVETLVWIVDFEGFSVKDAMDPRFSVNLVSMLQAHYPERMAHIICLSAPSAFSGLWMAVKGLMDKNTRQKIVSFCFGHFGWACTPCPSSLQHCRRLVTHKSKCCDVPQVFLKGKKGISELATTLFEHGLKPQTLNPKAHLASTGQLPSVARGQACFLPPCLPDSHLPTPKPLPVSVCLLAYLNLRPQCLSLSA